MRRAISIILTVFIAVFTAVSYADGYFIICNPSSWVNVRRTANKDGVLLGRVECCDYVETDGKKKNGFIHLINLPFEEKEGWIHRGYLVPDKPVIEEYKAYVCSRWKVVCRRFVNGARKALLKNGRELTIYAHSEEWAVTDRGFIKAEYLERWGGAVY